MMNLDMDPKRRLGHFDTVVSPTTSSITYHHRNLATEFNSKVKKYISVLCSIDRAMVIHHGFGIS